MRVIYFAHFLVALSEARRMVLLRGWEQKIRHDRVASLPLTVCRACRQQRIVVLNSVTCSLPALSPLTHENSEKPRITFSQKQIAVASSVLFKLICAGNMYI